MTSLVRRFVFALTIAAVGAAFGAAVATAQEDEKLSGLAAYASPDEPPAFKEPGDAVAALEKTLADDDFDAMAALLGLDAAELRTNDDVMQSYQEIRERAAERVIVSDEADEKILLLGRELWPFPFPISKTEEDTWAFDTYAGFEEIIARRVGENELTAIATVRSYVDAQIEYGSVDWDGDGMFEYAQKLISSPGQTDGLYWPPDQGDGVSPAGPYIDQAEADDAADDGYFGYRFRILTSQGDNVAGGSYDYVINGNMIAGFALIAWPVNYGLSGVNTFIVSHHGIVYQRDLGDSTKDIVPFIDRFNPDEDWEIVGPFG
jgi:hypothetical protein